MRLTFTDWVCGLAALDRLADWENMVSIVLDFTLSFGGRDVVSLRFLLSTGRRFLPSARTLRTRLAWLIRSTYLAFYYCLPRHRRQSKLRTPRRRSRRQCSQLGHRLPQNPRRLA